MIKGINNVLRIPTSLEGNFFKYWLDFLSPLHHFSGRMLEVATCFLKKHYELSKVIKDAALLEKITMGEDTKRDIKEECNISNTHFQIIMGKLKHAGFIVDNKINPKFIPNVDEQGSFKLLLYFDMT